MVSVGTIVWLSSEPMFFAGLFAMYFTIRSVEPELWAEKTAVLNIPFATINTAVLVISSVWCQLGVHAAEHGKAHRGSASLFDLKNWGMREWYVLTYVFGAIFVSGQVLEYSELVHEGISLSSDPYGSRDRRSARLPAHHRAHLHHPPLQPRTGGRRRRDVVLLALRRCRMDRTVRDDLPAAVTTMAATALSTAAPATTDRTAL
jgi:hypothetical protein